MAFSDQDILNFINNLKKKSLIEQASIDQMNENLETAVGNNNKKKFIIKCKLKVT